MIWLWLRLLCVIVLLLLRCTVRTWLMWCVSVSRRRSRRFVIVAVRFRRLCGLSMVLISRCGILKLVVRIVWRLMVIRVRIIVLVCPLILRLGV